MGSLLTVEGLSVAFRGEGGESTYVDGVGFAVDAGETVCIVGESGCGKSVTVLSMMGLLGDNGRVTAGEVRFDGQNLLALTPAALDKVRGNTLTMIFQDAMSSLNPVLTIGRQLTEAIHAHQRLTQPEAHARAVALLGRVGLSEPERLMRKYPHTLSGGMRQRVMIAMALCCSPKLLIADEPTTALDVTIQAQIMRLLADLKREFGMALLLITHDMGLVAEMADRVLVMYAGPVVEAADVNTLFAHPRHPYTQALLRSVPSIRDGAGRRLNAILGVVPEQYEQLGGCRFFGRCEQAVPACEHMPQPLKPLGGGACARCWLAGGQPTKANAPLPGDESSLAARPLPAAAQQPTPQEKPLSPMDSGLGARRASVVDARTTADAPPAPASDDFAGQVGPNAAGTQAADKKPPAPASDGGGAWHIVSAAGVQAASLADCGGTDLPPEPAVEKGERGRGA